MIEKRSLGKFGVTFSRVSLIIVFFGISII
jgi:hypothetical protein